MRFIFIFLSFLEDDNSEKSKNTPETSRRENVLVMRLTNKEQEVQEYVVCSHFCKILTLHFFLIWTFLIQSKQSTFKCNCIKLYTEKLFGKHFDYY